MSCNSPNRVFYVGVNEETGKRRILYTSRFVDFVYRHNPHDSWKLASGCDNESLKIMKASGYTVCTDYDDVPCGQCIGCRLDHAKQWAVRIMEEKKKYPDELCWFITVTYDDEHLPDRRMLPDKVDPDTGEVLTMKRSEFYSVSKRDHQLFMKRLRKEFQPKSELPLKFFASGEYGSTSFRPHYHYILFGLKIDDLQYYKSNTFGDKLYTSPSIEACWKHGFCTIGSVTLDSAGYIARYAIKKRKMTDNETYEKIGVDPEFIVMSRRPGIGRTWIDENLDDVYKFDKIVLPDRDGVVVMKPPKYFDSLLERVDPEKYEKIKERRREKQKQQEDFITEYMPFYDKEEQLAIKERKLNKSIVNLKRRDLDG